MNKELATILVSISKISERNKSELCNIDIFDKCPTYIACRNCVFILMEEYHKSYLCDLNKTLRIL
jgi:hypothetical protein